MFGHHSISEFPISTLAAPAAPEAPSSASWQGSRPDSILRRAVNAALIPAFFWSNFTPVPPIPVQTYPVYPDAVESREYPTCEQPFLSWVPGLPNLAIPDLSWEPSYPDRLTRPFYSVTEQQAEFWVGGLPNLAIPDLSWDPEYPNRLVEPVYPVADQGYLFWVGGLPNLPIPPLSWEPEYPVRVPGDPPIPQSPSIFFVPTIAPAVPFLSWSPSYPDRITEPLYPVYAQPSWAGGFFIPPAAPLLAWSPEYPDFITVELPVTEFPFFVKPLKRIPVSPVGLPYDTFTGTDGDLIDEHPLDLAPVGASWVPIGPSASNGNIQGNRLRIQDAGDGQTRGWVVESTVSDCEIRVRTFTNAVNPAWMGIVFRDNGATRFTARHQKETQAVFIYDPTGAAIATAAMVINNGDEIHLTIMLDGQNLRAVFVNVTTPSTVILEASSALNQFATLHGVSSRTAFGAGDSDFYDEFRVTVRPPFFTPVYPDELLSAEGALQLPEVFTMQDLLPPVIGTHTTFTLLVRYESFTLTQRSLTEDLKARGATGEFDN